MFINEDFSRFGCVFIVRIQWLGNIKAISSERENEFLLLKLIFHFAFVYNKLFRIFSLTYRALSHSLLHTQRASLTIKSVYCINISRPSAKLFPCYFHFRCESLLLWQKARTRFSSFGDLLRCLDLNWKEISGCWLRFRFFATHCLLDVYLLARGSER